MAIDSNPIPTQVTQYTDALAIAAVEGEATLALTGTQSGLSTTGNIQFPAVAVPSADANAFDDYEEGTWTPTLTFLTPGDLAVVYAEREGWYRKLGGVVVVGCNISTSTFTHSTASGKMRVSGIPFVNLGSDDHPIGSWAGITSAGYTQLGIRSRIDEFYDPLRSGSGVGSNNIYTTEMPTGGTVRLHFTASYRVA